MFHSPVGSLHPCAGNMRNAPRCRRRQSRSHKDGYEPPQPSPWQGCLVVWNSICQCWLMIKHHKCPVSKFYNKDSYCTSIRAGPLCCHCHRNAFSSYTKGTANIQQTAFQEFIRSAAKRYLCISLWKTITCITSSRVIEKSTLYTRNVSLHWALLPHLWKQSTGRMCKQLYLQVAQLCSEKPGGKFSP